MDRHGLKPIEADLTPRLIQRTAMSERSKMRQVADRIVDGSLRPS